MPLVRQIFPRPLESQIGGGILSGGHSTHATLVPSGWRSADW
jgi:hypothetical protein